MSWMMDIEKTIQYIEEHLEEDIDLNGIAQVIHLSPLYFQKSFTILCGITPSEYIRNRRLSLAGRDLQSGQDKVIDIAMRYGYESPDSFTKAFTRFHGVTPNEVKNNNIKLRYFLPLSIHIDIRGGFEMNFRIVKKPAFTLVGYSKIIPYEDGYKMCPQFWSDHYATGRGKFICGMYGICIDENVDIGRFKYMIADDYLPTKDYPSDVETTLIPENTWGVFSCIGPLPNALQEVNTSIFKEWLPNNPEYEIAGGYNIEYYSDASKYPNGTEDEHYQSEIWIPLKAKK